MPTQESSLETLLAAAVEMGDQGQREAYLQRVCAGDAAQLAELQSMVHDYFAAGSLIDRPAVVIATVDFTSQSYIDQRIGPYKLLEQIGEGGMGTVYMAEQKEPVRRMVALKVIKPGMDTRQVVARFEAERQALALMNHPNIAKVLDAGATDAGRPYFVMELVKGLPITEFCDQLKLDTRQRLQLFITVCQAVQHAHQKGLIHRDLKPSNVLVEVHDVTPVPKVIDFGVAKAIGQQLTDKTLHTGFSEMVGTPLYMSPEQAGQSSIDVDTRSDIYSLGVLLYELLTGTTPFDKDLLTKAGYDEMRRIIREDEPPRPSARVSTLQAKALSTVSDRRQVEPRKLSQLFRGELDWIVMKALEKDRTRRYESASVFAGDVERYLKDEPVEACPPSTGYRLAKFLRRNKGPVVAAGVVLAALLAGMVGTTLGLVRATTAERVAKQRFGEAEIARAKAEKAEADTLADYRASTDDAIEQLIGSKAQLGPKEKTYLKNTLKRWQAFAGRQGADERSQAIRGEGHFRVAKLWAKLGRNEEAQAELQVARDLQKKLVAQFPAVPAHQQDLAKSHNSLGIVLADLGKREEARAEYQAARDLRKRLVEQFPAVPVYQHELAGIDNNLGNLLADLGKREEARAKYQTARDLHKRLVEQYPSVPEYRADLAHHHHNLGRLLAGLGKGEEARAEHQAAHDLRKRLVEQYPDVPAYQHYLAETHSNLGELLAGLGKGEEARAEFQTAHDLRKRLVEQFPAVPAYQHEMAHSHNNLGNVLASLGKGEEARAEYQASRDLLKRLVEQFPAVPAYLVDLASSHNNLGVLLANLGKRKEARAEYQAAHDLRKRLVEQYPDVPAHQQNLADTHNNLGFLLANLGKREEERAEYQAARDIWKKLVDQISDVPKYQEELASTRGNLGSVLANLGKREDARAEYQAAGDLWKKLVEQFPAVPEYQISLGGDYCNYGNLIREEGKPAESLEWYDLAIRTLKPVHEKESRHVRAQQFLRNSHLGRAQAYDRLQKPAEANNDWDRTIELSPPAEQPRVRASRATSRLQAGMVAEAVAEVAELTKNPNWDADQWYGFSCVYSLASGKIADKQQEYADRAMELLTKAVEAGFGGTAHMAKDTDLASLRDRDDFRKLLERLSKEKPNGP